MRPSGPLDLVGRPQLLEAIILNHVYKCILLCTCFDIYLARPLAFSVSNQPAFAQSFIFLATVLLTINCRLVPGYFFVLLVEDVVKLRMFELIQQLMLQLVGMIGRTRYNAIHCK